MISYPRETTEYLAIPVLDTAAGLPGTPVTTGVQVSITSDRVRPTVWMAAVVIGNNCCILLTGMSPGLYKAWAKVTASPEAVVLEAGTFEIT